MSVGSGKSAMKSLVFGTGPSSTLRLNDGEMTWSGSAGLTEATSNFNLPPAAICHAGEKTCASFESFCSGNSCATNEADKSSTKAVNEPSAAKCKRNLHE